MDIQTAFVQTGREAFQSVSDYANSALDTGSRAIKNQFSGVSSEKVNQFVLASIAIFAMASIATAKADT